VGPVRSERAGVGGADARGYLRYEDRQSEPGGEGLLVIRGSAERAPGGGAERGGLLASRGRPPRRNIGADTDCRLATPGKPPLAALNVAVVPSTCSAALLFSMTLRSSQHGGSSFASTTPVLFSVLPTLPSLPSCFRGHWAPPPYRPHKSRRPSPRRIPPFCSCSAQRSAMALTSR